MSSISTSDKACRDGPGSADLCSDESVFDCPILIVDDEPANVTVLLRLLRDAGYRRVEGVTDPCGALEAFAALQPDVVLLDLHMPSVDGFQLMRQFRASSPRGSFLPIMVITADATLEARQKAFTEGASDFLTKPFEFIDCKLRVRNLLHIRRLHQRLAAHNDRMARTIHEHERERELIAARHRAINERLDAVIASDMLTMVFQPIIGLNDGDLHGVEALARFVSEPFRPPNEWFAEAAEAGRGVELEIWAIDKALRQQHLLPPDAFVSVNTSPATLQSERLADVLSGYDETRIVLELTEHESVQDYSAALKALEPLRLRGARLAVDDTGAGFAGLQHLLQLQPDIIKLDRSVVASIEDDFVRRAIASAITQFSADLGSLVIAEGIETQAELDTVRALGIQLGQGYRLGRPGPLSGCLPHERLPG